MDGLLGRGDLVLGFFGTGGGKVGFVGREARKKNCTSCLGNLCRCSLCFLWLPTTTESRVGLADFIDSCAEER